ncbi:hypothetical protein [Agromyces sp. GXQ0307]
MLRRAPRAEKGVEPAVTSLQQGGCRVPLEPAASAPSVVRDGRC